MSLPKLGRGRLPTDTRVRLALQECKLAKLDGAALFYGEKTNRIADSFAALTYVDVAGATNLDSSVAGLLKPTRSGGTTQTIGTNSTTNNFGAGATMFDMATALTNGDVITSIGAYSTGATSLTLKIGKRTAAGSFDIVVSQVVAHPGGGFVDFALTSSFVIPGTGTYYVGAYGASTLAATAVKARGVKTGDITGTGQTGFTEDTGNLIPLRVIKNPTTDNATLLTQSLPAPASAPKNAWALLRVKEVDTVVANTDYTLEVSRDGGTTWIALTLSKLYTGVDGVAVVISSVTPFTGATGTSMKFRFKTLNNKMVELHDWLLEWN